MTYYDDSQTRIIRADVFDGLAQLEDKSVHCVVSSPPFFGLRKYHGKQTRIWSDGWQGAYGNEPTPDCGRPFMKLRDDLTDKERDYVIEELKKCGLI